MTKDGFARTVSTAYIVNKDDTLISVGKGHGNYNKEVWALSAKDHAVTYEATGSRKD